MRLSFSVRPQLEKHSEVLEYLDKDKEGNRSALIVALLWEAIQAREGHAGQLAQITQQIQDLARNLKSGTVTLTPLEEEIPQDDKERAIRALSKAPWLT